MRQQAATYFVKTAGSRGIARLGRVFEAKNKKLMAEYDRTPSGALAGIAERITGKRSKRLADLARAEKGHDVAWSRLGRKRAEGATRRRASMGARIAKRRARIEQLAERGREARESYW
jgi:hypothetical protein